MKIARFVLKIVALSLATAAAVCALIAYWSKLEELCESARGRRRRNACISEYDDYEEKAAGPPVERPAALFVPRGRGGDSGCPRSAGATGRTAGRPGPPPPERSSPREREWP